LKDGNSLPVVAAFKGDYELATQLIEQKFCPILSRHIALFFKFLAKDSPRSLMKKTILNGGLDVNKPDKVNQSNLYFIT